MSDQAVRRGEGDGLRAGARNARLGRAATHSRELRAAALEGCREARPLAVSDRQLGLFLAARWVYLATSLLGRDDHAVFRAAAPRIVRIVGRKLPALVGR
jgi:hypothetical protein